MANTRKAAPDLPERIARCLVAHLPPGARLSVAYSGGLDSTVLLHVLAGLRARLGLQLSACHVHHGLSPHADAWAVHCQRVCAGLEVPLSVHPVHVAAAGEGLEAAARAARYRVFESLNVEAVALAQHRDDQAETVLLQLLRGADLRGLAAMPVVRRLATGQYLLRPLLDVPRAALLDWAQAQGWAWIEDESNARIDLARNALRHQVLPALTRGFPSAVAELAATAERFAEAAGLLDQLARDDAQAAMDGEGLRIAVLGGLSTPRALNLLRHFVAQGGGRVRRPALQEALRQLLAAGADTQVAVRFGARVLRRHRGVALLAALPVASGGEDRVWQGETRIALPDGGVLILQAAQGQGVRLSPGGTRLGVRRGGERWQPAGNRPARPLNDWLREAGVPAWQRASLPLLYVGKQLAWVASLGADAAFQVGPDEPGWLISWVPPGPR